MRNGVFISYSHLDKPEVRHIVQVLSTALGDKLDIWYDESLTAGTPFTPELEQKILGYRFFMFMASRHSFKSSFCSKEVDLAINSGKGILLLFLEDCEYPSGFRLAFSGDHSIRQYDMTDSQLEMALRNSILSRPAEPDDTEGDAEPLPRTMGELLEQMEASMNAAECDGDFDRVLRRAEGLEGTMLFRRATGDEKARLYKTLLWAERRLFPSEDPCELLIPPFSGRYYSAACRYGLQEVLRRINQDLCARIEAFQSREVDLNDRFFWSVESPEQCGTDYRYLWDCLLYRTDNLTCDAQGKTVSQIRQLRRWYAAFEAACPPWLLRECPSPQGVCPRDRAARYFEALEAIAARNTGEAEYEQGMRHWLDCEFEQAVDLFQKAAAKDYPEAYYLLGLCHTYGEGVRVDLEEANRLFCQAADLDLVVAQRDLGRCYLYGEGVKPDPAKALYWYRRAAELDDPWAQYMVGRSIDLGLGSVEAFEMYRKAAENGNADAQYELARCYEYGRGVPPNTEKSAVWYREAAEQGLVVAQNALGVAFSFGEGLPEDKTEGVRWYRKAAEKGLAYAQYNLAMAYYYAQGVDKDEKEAILWFMKAAEQGDPDAQYSLGISYMRGSGVPQDDEEGLRWLQTAEENGNGRAQNFLKHYRRRHLDAGSPS